MSLNDKIISKLLKYERILNVFIVQLCFISYFFVGGEKKKTSTRNLNKSEMTKKMYRSYYFKGSHQSHISWRAWTGALSQHLHVDPPSLRVPHLTTCPHCLQRHSLNHY